MSENSHPPEFPCCLPFLIHWKSVDHIHISVLDTWSIFTTMTRTCFDPIKVFQERRLWIHWMHEECTAAENAALRKFDYLWTTCRAPLNPSTRTLRPATAASTGWMSHGPSSRPAADPTRWEFASSSSRATSLPCKRPLERSRRCKIPICRTSLSILN